MVWLHRWTGLVMAGFLILEGATGALLAFRVPLERVFAPQLFAAPRPGFAPLGLGELAERAQRRLPDARIAYFWLEDRRAILRVVPRPDDATGEPRRVGFDHVFLDPWTGAELGRRQEGDLSQGAINLVPFIYALHMNLAAGEGGMLVLGVVALAWTLDCLVGFYLTLPVTRTRMLRRWAPAWRLKSSARAVRVHFDLHRAGGLWLWPLLFVFGWSSVMFNLPQVYAPVTRALFDLQDDMDMPRRFHLHRNPAPRLSWTQAQRVGEALLAGEAQRHGFTLNRPYGMAYIEDWGIYTYTAASSADVQAHAWSTSVSIDGDSGAWIATELPRGQHAGNTVGTWLRALHFADLQDSTAYRIAVAALGGATMVLSVTGIYIWHRKRRARLWVSVRRRLGSGAG